MSGQTVSVHATGAFGAVFPGDPQDGTPLAYVAEGCPMHSHAMTVPLRKTREGGHMEMFFFGAAVAVLFCGTFLLLTTGYLEKEEERARQSTSRPTLKVAPLHRFFGDPGRDRPEARNEEADRALVTRIEEYVRREESLVADFVSDPSVDTLYRGAGEDAHPKLN